MTAKKGRIKVRHWGRLFHLLWALPIGIFVSFLLATLGSLFADLIVSIVTGSFSPLPSDARVMFWWRVTSGIVSLGIIAATTMYATKVEE